MADAAGTPGTRLRTDRGLERLVTFLDAVVAIAITLLVLPLVDLVGSEGDAPRASEVIGDHPGEIAAFVLSFVVIARLWTAHHALLEHAGGYDQRFLWLNLAWAFTIVVLPFATQLTRADDDALARGVYIGTMAASAACLAGLAKLLADRPALRREEDHGLVRTGPLVHTAIAFLLALVLGVAVPGVGYWGLLLLLVDGRAARVIASMRGSRS